MRLGQQVVAVDERDLEVREVRVEPVPVQVPGLVLVHVLRERRLRELLEAARLRSGRSAYRTTFIAARSATAWAASPSPRPVKPEPVRRRRANRHSARFDSKRSREALAHLLADVTDARLLADEDAVGVDEPPPRFANLAVGLPQEIERRRSAVLLVARREERADVAEVRSAEDARR